MPCSFLRAAVLPTQTSRKLLALLLCLAASSASAARVNVTVEGVSPELQTVILGAVELQQYASREVSRAQVQRLYRRAERQVRYALEPYGYYNPTFTSKLDQDGETYTARLQVDAGPAVTITRLDLEIEGLPDLKVEQAFELSDASAERSAAGCTVHLNKEPIIEYINSNITLLKWMIAEGYADARSIGRRIRKMEAFIITLVGVIGISFLVQVLLASPPVGELAMGFIPGKMSEEALYIAIGIIGATVMPHNLYLHSALVQTRKIDRSVATHGHGQEHVFVVGEQVQQGGQVDPVGKRIDRGGLKAARLGQRHSVALSLSSPSPCSGCSAGSRASRTIRWSACG